MWNNNVVAQYQGPSVEEMVERRRVWRKGGKEEDRRKIGERRDEKLFEGKDLESDSLLSSPLFALSPSFLSPFLLSSNVWHNDELSYSISSLSPLT